MRKNSILATLKDEKEHIERCFSVNSIGLFGSFARDDIHSKSDIDILVTFSEPTFNHYMELKFYLEDLFGRPVDLVMEQTVKKRLKKMIQQETLYV
ncbi:MAG: nucleotidyltransferase family protein [Candidatus Electrothrix scaldis]|nr:MAG: nucleotidyltransferase family protein [Candidatus Electrothrix sp. GW3-3]